MAVMRDQRPLLSVEAAATLVAGLVVGLIPEMSWWLRALGVMGTGVLAIHTGKRIEQPIALRIGFPLATIIILVLGTTQSIWFGFHADLPAVTEDSALSKIVEFCAVAAAGVSCYIFLLRPRQLDGYRVLPAQVIAFGISMMAVGLLTAGVGLLWQFKQNWDAGTTPVGAPVQPSSTSQPLQITRASPPARVARASAE
jgi:hypothetical protein